MSTRFKFLRTLFVFSLVLSTAMPTKVYAGACPGGCGQEEGEGGEAGGGAGGGGGGGGGGAAQILSALAMAMMGAAPMVAQVIQSNNDVKIAQINANTQQAITAMSAQTSLALAQTQQNIALNQAQTARQVVDDNNQAAAQRLDMQLGVIQQQSNQQIALQQQRDQMLYTRQQQQIEVAQQQAADQQMLALQQLNAQKEAAGLFTGAAYQKNSGLNVTPVGIPVASTLNSTPGSGGSLASQFSGMTGTGLSARANARLLSPGGKSNSSELAMGLQQSATSVKNARETLRTSTQAKKAADLISLAKNTKTFQLYEGGQVGKQLYQVLNSNHVARGTFRADMQYRKPTSLDSFLSAATNHAEYLGGGLRPHASFAPTEAGGGHR